MSQGNNALWHFSIEMAKEARARDVDVLALYNATLQASSWDGSAYGEELNVVVAYDDCELAGKSGEYLISRVYFEDRVDSASLLEVRMDSI